MQEILTKVQVPTVAVWQRDEDTRNAHRPLYCFDIEGSRPRMEKGWTMPQVVAEIIWHASQSYSTGLTLDPHRVEAAVQALAASDDLPLLNDGQCGRQFIRCDHPWLQVGEIPADLLQS